MSERLNISAQSLSKVVGDSESIKIESAYSIAVEEHFKMFNSMINELCTNTSFINLEKSSHNKLLNALLESNSFIEAIWTNDIKGRFICSIPEAGIANAGVREWFKKSIKGELFVSQPYISAITKNPCVTLSAPLRNTQDEIIGVIGIDIKL
jgi:SMC interacting uncharacterized protein involved in chromosome segregation